MESAGSAPRGTRLLPAELVLPFALVTSLFALWGFANDITNPMVAAFKTILLVSHFESSLVQAAFYGGYCFMAIPAALFIHRRGYRAGIVMGLALYVAGCLLFVPAGASMAFGAFLLAYFVMTCGLSFLETTANPCVLAMGSPQTATRRLNLAQAFNPLGSILGMFVARDFILHRLNPADEAARSALRVTDPAAFTALQRADLAVVVWPYVMLGLAVGLVLVAFLVLRPALPEAAPGEAAVPARALVPRLFRNRRYLGGVVAQAFYVGAQICCWTFIIQYGVTEAGLTAAQAQTYNIVAMAIFVTSRFVCTLLLRFIDPGWLLMTLAGGGITLTGGVMAAPGEVGIVCLVGISACMSLMFPTIYGLALDGMGEEAKLASAGLILAIGGGCLLPPLQAMIMDGPGLGGWSAVRISFVLVAVCFVVIAVYGGWMARRTRA